MFSKALQVSNHLGYRGVCNLGSMNSLCPVLYTKIWHLQATRNDSFFFFFSCGRSQGLSTIYVAYTSISIVIVSCRFYHLYFL